MENDFSAEDYLSQKKAMTDAEKVNLVADEEKEIELLRKEHEGLEADALYSTRRALKMALETEEIGIKTSDRLKEQGETLDATEKTMAKTDANAELSRKDAKKVKRYDHMFGLSFHGFFDRKKKHDKVVYQEQKEALSKQRTIVESQPRARFSEHTPDPEDPLGTLRGSVVQNDDTLPKRRYRNENDREADENLEAIDAVVSHMKVIGMDMGQEMDRQDVIMDQIALQGTHVDKSIVEANKNIKKFVN